MKQMKASLNKGSFEVSAEVAPDEKTSIQVKGNSIAAEDIKALTAITHIPSMLDTGNIHGNIKTMQISIIGNKEKLKVDFTIYPDGLVVEGQDHKQLLKIDNGMIAGSDNSLDVAKLTGRLGDGSFCRWTYRVCG